MIQPEFLVLTTRKRSLEKWLQIYCFNILKLLHLFLPDIRKLFFQFPKNKNLQF